MSHAPRAQYTTELLHHFQCPDCRRYWTYGEQNAPKRRPPIKAFCPCCGEESIYYPSEMDKLLWQQRDEARGYNSSGATDRGRPDDSVER